MLSFSIRSAMRDARTREQVGEILRMNVALRRDAAVEQELRRDLQEVERPLGER
jgi:hypothetical protein